MTEHIFPELDRDERTGRWGTEIEGEDHADWVDVDDDTGRLTCSVPSLIVELAEDGMPDIHDEDFGYAPPPEPSVILEIADGSGRTCIRLDDLEHVAALLRMKVYEVRR